MHTMKYVILLLSSLSMLAQTLPTKELSYEEFLGYVKKFHPRAKMAQLQLSEAQASLMAARGAFDPKIEVDFSQKQFMGKEYYGLLNSSFKIPTWYGIEVKAGFDNNDGVFLNPENTMPQQGLYSVGISVPLGQGLWINQRMADLQKAKAQLNLSRAQQTLDAIDVLYDASLAYFEWKKSDQEVRLYTQYVQNATVRYGAIKTLIIQGDKPGIDSIEAGINVRNRKLNLSEAQLKRTKAKLELANFLWLDNLIPMELQDDIVPEVNLENTIQNTLGTTEILTANIDIEQHPKIAALNQKRSLLDIDRKLKANMLLPKADVGYQYLSEDRYRNTPFENNYKLGMNVNFPLFLRKERGNLKLAKLKVQDVQWEISLERVQLSNKIKGQQAAVKTMEEQKNMAKQLTQDYQTMLRAEERLFGLGESSFFILNMRENNLVSAQITAIQLENSYFQSNAKLYQTTAQTQAK